MAVSCPQKPLRLMFEDEARFGLMMDPHRCWAPAGSRPEVSRQRVRQYTHVFGAVCPRDGKLTTLILPEANTEAMSRFLAEVSRRYAQEHILMFMDRAAWHCAHRLKIPSNMTLDWLPPYSPECNPEELVWREVRRSSLANRDFDDLTALENELEGVLREMESAPDRLRPLTGFDWIVNGILNAS